MKTYKFIKRIGDVFIAGVGVVLCLPIWIVVPILIKLESKGPVFFAHERVGKNGQEFLMFKFRTMFETVPEYELAPKGRDDPRVTDLGKILRRWSIDELPQLINVLKGDMSIVGPRPEMPFLAKRWTSWQQQRLEVPQGITGLWQVIGRKDITLQNHLEYDIYYLQHKSIRLDLSILLKTIPVVISRRGAY